MRELEQPKPRSRPHLAWSDGAGNHSLELVEPRTCGSAASCELVVADKAVSRIHFELDPAPDGLWVRDLASRNGTYVNGIRITEARIPAGSVIRVGTTDITVTYGAPDTAADPSLAELVAFGDMIGYSASLRAVLSTAKTLAATAVATAKRWP